MLPRSSRRAGLAVALVALLVALAACTGDEEGSTAATATTTTPHGARPGGTLRVAIPGEALPLDPAVAPATSRSAAFVAEVLHGRLTSTDPDTGAARPALAERWELAPDARTATFTLRPGATFSDGTPITAADVVASLRRVVAQGPGSVASARLDPIAGHAAAAADPTAPLEGLVAVDERTVRLTLTRPDADLPAALAAPAYAIVPSAVARAAPPGQPAVTVPGPGAPAPVTSGPYRWAAGDAERATLERRPDIDPALAPPASVELRRVADAPAGAQLWGAGDVDLTALPADPAATSLPAGVGVVRTTPAAPVWWLGLNLADGALADLRLRQAVEAALDRPALQALFAGRAAVDGLAPPEALGAEGVGCRPACDRDLTRARALLADAAPDGLTLRLDVDDAPEVVALADAVRAQLGEAGIAVEVRSRPFAQYRDGALVADRQLFWFGWVGMAPSAGDHLAPTFATGAPANVVGLADPAIDQALTAAASTLDDTARGEAWAGTQRFVLDQVVAIPLVQARSATAVAEAVQGFELRLDGTPVLDRLWIASPG